MNIFKQYSKLTLLGLKSCVMIMLLLISCSDDDKPVVASPFLMKGVNKINESSIKVNFNKPVQASDQTLLTTNYKVTFTDLKQPQAVSRVEVKGNELTLYFGNKLNTGLYTLEITNIIAQDDTKLRDPDINFYFENYPNEPTIEVLDNYYFKLTYPKNINPESYIETNFLVTRNGKQLEVKNIFGSQNVVFISVFIKPNEYKGGNRIIKGNYKIITNKLLYEDGEEVTKTFNITANPENFWKKRVNIKVKTSTDINDPTTYTFYNLKEDRTYTIKDKTEAYNELMNKQDTAWDLVFAFDGYNMNIYSARKSRDDDDKYNTERLNVIRPYYVFWEYATKINRSNGFWCYKDAKNEQRFNMLRDTYDAHVPFNIYKSSFSGYYSVPTEYADIEGKMPGNIIIDDIYGGVKPTIVPSNFVYNVSLYYLIELKKEQRLNLFPFDGKE